MTLTSAFIKAPAVAAIVPAAGLSSRMGAFKPLLEVAGKPLLVWTLTALVEAGVDPIVLVLGNQAEVIEAELERRFGELSQTSIQTVRNPDFATSDMLTSLQLGLAALLKRVECSPSAACVLPGDIAAIKPTSITALLVAHRSDPDVLLRPSYKERGGHPLLLPRSFWSAVLDFQGSGGLRAALAGEAISNVSVDDPGVLLDADRPEDIERLETLL